MAIEQEGLLTGRLAIADRMGNEAESWAGIYGTRTTPEPSSMITLLGIGTLGLG